MATPMHTLQTLLSFWSVVIFFAVCPADVVGEGEFLRTGNPNVTQHDFLQELEAAIGRDHRIATERRVSRLEEAMRPTFNALPKCESGRLDGTGVRYMLRRLFVQRHGWFVNGLETNGEAWNSSSPTNMVGHVAGVDAQGVFDKQLNTHGFDLHHAAVMAATLEHFVHSEVAERLKVAYNVIGLSPDDSNTSELLLSNVIQTYLLMYVLHKDHSNATRGWVMGAAEIVPRVYHNWDNVVNFMSEIRSSILESDREQEYTALPRSWNTTLRVVETFGERYGRWQNRDCMSMKRKLVEMDVTNTGRVPLWRFYEHAFDDSEWLFKESLESLQRMGMVDDSDPSDMNVIIPNYMNGQNNCVAGGKFYSVCCIDECDELVSHLEEHLVTSEAKPEQISDLVAGLPSDTVTAPRTLPDDLLQRLRDIANHHGGLVPLHGRLFAQWMHHAYPRECSFPHVSGTTSPIMSYQLMAMGAAITPEHHADLLSNVKKERILNDVGNENTTSEISDSIPWTSDEELFVCPPKPEDQDAVIAFVLKFILIVAFSGVLVFARLHWMSTEKSMAAPADACRNKYYV